MESEGESNRSSMCGSNNNYLQNQNSCNSSDLNEISVDNSNEYRRKSSNMGLKFLPNWPAANIEFQDIVHTVPDLKNGKKMILRGISGNFRSGELTAIMGPSGSGKTTLLNILAGYKSTTATGQIYINGRPREMKIFRKMSRYIMQNEVLDPFLTVRESMMVSANLKLGNDLSVAQKNEVIDEILDTLRLTKSQHTIETRLSGGEKKRLSIALELVNNPPIIFLDEPTTGLDDLSSSQCISLLRRIAHAGRTIVCSIHTPSAKLFEMFDHVYVVAEGQCVYQGSGSHIVPYVKSLGLNCPRTYNPADFIIELACGEYGNDYHDKMVTAVDNGRNRNWNEHYSSTQSQTYPESKCGFSEIPTFSTKDINPMQLKSRSSWFQQFTILLKRMLLTMWRDTFYIKLKFCMTVLLGLIVGGIYQGVGNDATKALFNFGFAFTIVIAYMYLPLMPILLQFPTEVRLLKREYFNQWYRLSSYYAAMTISKLPMMIGLALIYLTMIYVMSNQPLELKRFLMLFFISVLIGMTSDSLGVLISSRLSIVNAMFVGPVTSVPLFLLSAYGVGYGKHVFIPSYMKFLMSMSYLRHGLEGLIAALYGDNRADTICPDTEVFCMFKKSKFLMDIIGFQNVNYVSSILALIINYIIFTTIAFIMIKKRLSFTTSNYVAVQYIGQFVKTHLNFASYKY